MGKFIQPTLPSSLVGMYFEISPYYSIRALFMFDIILMNEWLELRLTILSPWFPCLRFFKGYSFYQQLVKDSAITVQKGCS